MSTSMKVLELLGALRNDRQRRAQLAAAKQLTMLLTMSAGLQFVQEHTQQPQPQMWSVPPHETFLAAGGMQAAVRLLSSNLSKANADLLRSACLVPGGAEALVAAGGMEPLVQLLRDTSAAGGSKKRSAALDVLSSATATSDQAQHAALAAGCVTLLVALIQGPIDQDSVTAVQILNNLALRHEEALLASGAVEALVQLVQQQEPRMLGKALKVLEWLTAPLSSRPQRQGAAAIAAAGGIAAAVGCLRGKGAPDWPADEFSSVPLLAAGLLGNLAKACPQFAADIQTAGAVPELEYMLRHCVTWERGRAATALANIRRAAEAATAAAVEAASQPAKPRQTCAAHGCGNMHGLKRCGGCHTVRYCSPACCKAHWREHKAECRRLQAEAAAATAAAEAAAGAVEAESPAVAEAAAGEAAAAQVEATPAAEEEAGNGSNEAA